MKQSAVPMPQHRDELNEQNAGEEAEKCEAQRFESKGIVVQTFDWNEDVVTNTFGDQLQREDDHQPECIDHEEDETTVVTERFQISNHLLLMIFVFDQGIEIVSDQFLEEFHFARLEHHDFGVEQRFMKDPSRIH